MFRRREAVGAVRAHPVQLRVVGVDHDVVGVVAGALDLQVAQHPAVADSAVVRVAEDRDEVLGVRAGELLAVLHEVALTAGVLRRLVVLGAACRRGARLGSSK
jgi:hypothetical protein